MQSIEQATQDEQTGFKKLILGSFSQTVSQCAPCAVAIVRGVAGSDKTLKRTDAFDRLKVLNHNDFGNKFSSSVSAVHSMPGGF